MAGARRNFDEAAQNKPRCNPQWSCLVNLSEMSADVDRQQLSKEAKAIVALAFRNGPIEDIHAGLPCPTCTGQAAYSRITDAEMKSIMKNAVDHVYALLLLKSERPEEYESQIRLGERYTARWDERDLYHQWVFFDDLWAGAHPELANSVLRFAARWDVLSPGRERAEF